MKIATKVFTIEGMSCASCVKKVESTLAHQTGVSSVSVNLASETASVTYDEDAIQPQNLQNHIAQIGYRMTLKGQATNQLSYWVQHKDLIELLVSIVLTLPLLIPMFGDYAAEHFLLSPSLQLFLALPIQFIIGSKFYRNSWRAILNRSPNMDVLVAVGTSSAFALSLYQGFFDPSHHQHLYFESSAVIITLVLLGKFLEKQAKFKTTEALRALDKLRPEVACVMRNGNERLVPVFKIVKGDLLIIKPGERIPVDGVISEGTSSLDESLITGESLPISKKIHDSVISGSLNLDGRLKITASAIESESMLSQIIRLIESAQGKKAPIQKLVDRVSEVFVPVIVLIALMTLIGWKLYGATWNEALVNSISVLVIACPCALGLATPTALMVGRGLAAKKGILIKDLEALENATKIKAIVFDKTGTLTEGKPLLIESQVNPNIAMTSDELLTLAYGVQNNNSHPLAKAVVQAALKSDIRRPHVSDAKIIPGKGSEARFQDSALIHIGSIHWMRELGLDTSVLEHLYVETLNKGLSVAWIANGTSKKILGYHAFSDQIKEGANLAIKELQRMSLAVVMLSGDKLEVAKQVGDKLGIAKIIAEVQPDQKLQHILELKKEFNFVAMIGDGVNDAPALAAADLGIAMGGGTDTAIGAAAVTLMKDDPQQVVESILIAQATYKKIKQNLFWAFFYNSIGVPLAALGMLNPMIAAAAMAFSSVSVVLNSLLLKPKPSRIQTNR